MRVRLGLVAASLVAAGLPLVAGVSPVCAGEGARAALVVDTGEAAYRYCVALPTDEVSGIDVIELAGEQHGLSYRLGYGGEAVCMLAGVGAEGDDCFSEYPEFWGYWRGEGSGGWAWSSTGAGSTTVGDGDIEGWSWGSGDGPESHQAPPRTTYAAVCPAPAASADPGDDRSPRPARPDDTDDTDDTGGAGGAGDTGPGAAATPPVDRSDSVGIEGKRRSEGGPRPGRSPELRAPRGSPSSVAEPTAVVGPPAGDARPEPGSGLWVLLVAGAIAGAALYMGRRRKGAGS